MKKIQTAQREEIYDSFISRGLEPKGCNNGTRGTRKLLYIHQHVLNRSKTKRDKLPMAWIDCKKANDMVPQNWILHCVIMYEIPDQVVKFFEKTTDSWRVEIECRTKTLAENLLICGLFSPSEPFGKIERKLKKA